MGRWRRLKPKRYNLLLTSYNLHPTPYTLHPKPYYDCQVATRPLESLGMPPPDAEEGITYSTLENGKKDKTDSFQVRVCVVYGFRVQGLGFRVWG